MGKLRFGTLSTLLAILFLSLPLSLAAYTIQQTKQFGQSRPDKALVYAIREKSFVGAPVGMFVLADDQLIAFLRNGTYSFAYIDPGDHLIWGDTSATMDMHLAGGETYYLRTRINGPLEVLNEEDGKAALDHAGAYILNDATDIENGSKRAAKRLGRAQKREARKDKAAIEEVTASAAAATTGSLKLPANTKLSIESMENLSSGLNVAGQTIWFRTADDVSIDGKVVIPRGAPVKATIRATHGGSSHGAAGTLNATLVSVDLDAAHRIPIVGDVNLSGRQRTSGQVVGGLAGLMITGTEAFEAAGSRHAAWIRDDTSLDPFAAMPAAAHAVSATTEPVALSFGTNSRGDIAAVRLSFPCTGEVAVVELVGVGEWPLPERVRALSAEKKKEACVADFAGWSLLRYVRPGADAQMLHLVGKTGTAEVYVDVPVTMKVD